MCSVHKSVKKLFWLQVQKIYIKIGKDSFKALYKEPIRQELKIDKFYNKKSYLTFQIKSLVFSGTDKMGL